MNRVRNAASIVVRIKRTAKTQAQVHGSEMLYLRFHALFCSIKDKFQIFFNPEKGFGRIREARKKAHPRYDPNNHKDAIWNVNYENQTSPVFAAKEYFDELYGDRFGHLWLNLRTALLSPKKQVAFVMNPNENLIESLESIGARDVMTQFCKRAKGLRDLEEQKLDKLEKRLFGRGSKNSDMIIFTLSNY